MSKTAYLVSYSVTMTGKTVVWAEGQDAAELAAWRGRPRAREDEELLQYEVETVQPAPPTLTGE